RSAGVRFLLSGRGSPGLSANRCFDGWPKPGARAAPTPPLRVGTQPSLLQVGRRTWTQAPPGTTPRARYLAPSWAGPRRRRRGLRQFTSQIAFETGSMIGAPHFGKVYLVGAGPGD